MRAELLKALLTALFTLLTPENMKRFVDAGLDAIEDAIAASSNTIDDAIVLPTINMIRTAFDIPDNDSKGAAYIQRGN